MKTTFEIGIMCVPIIFLKTGWIVGSIILPIVAVTMYYILTLQIKTCEHLNISPKNFPDFLQLTLG